MQNIQIANLPHDKVLQILGDSWEDLWKGDLNGLSNYCVCTEELDRRGWMVVSNPLMIGKIGKKSEQCFSQVTL